MGGKVIVTQIQMVYDTTTFEPYVEMVVQIPIEPLKTDNDRDSYYTYLGKSIIQAYQDFKINN